MILRAIGSIDDELIERAAQKNTVRKMKFMPGMKRLAPVAACAAIALFCVWAIPDLLNAPVPDTDGDVHAVTTPGDTNLHEPDSPQLDVATGPPQTDIIYKLTLNNIDSLEEARLFIPGHFWYELNDEQFEAILPEFSRFFPFRTNAIVNHYGDGSLFNVVVREIAGNGDVAMFNEYHARTEIVIAPGEIADCAIYEYEAVASLVNGVYVVAGVMDRSDSMYDAALYIAEFKVGGTAYVVRLSDSPEGDNGSDRLTEIVNQIVRNAPADLSVLEPTPLS